MPNPLETRPSADPYPKGHAVYRDEETQGEVRRVVEAEGITFVDVANVADTAQDGTFEHPYATIGQAVELAGENTTIFVREGLYREEVVLRPGQTLTSLICYRDSISWCYSTDTLPLIAPDQVSLRHRAENEDGEVQEYGAVVTMREDTEVSRMAVVTTAPRTVAVWAEPAPGSEDFFIGLGYNELSSSCGDALRVQLRGGVRAGKIVLWDNTLLTCSFMTGALWAAFEPGTRLHVGADGKRAVLPDDATGITLTVNDNKLYAPFGICAAVDLLGRGNTVHFRLNTLCGDRGFCMDLGSRGNSIKLRDNTICATSGQDSDGIYVDDFSSEKAGPASTFDIYGNSITVRSALACGVWLREWGERKEHSLDFAQITERNNIHAWGDDAKTLSACIRDFDRDREWLRVSDAE